MGGLRVATHFEFHLQARAEPVQDGHQAIHREPPQIGIADARKIGRRDPGATLRHTNTQTLPVQHLDDLRRQDGFELLDVRVFMTQIAEDIAASPPDSASFHTRDVVISDNNSSSIEQKYPTSLAIRAWLQPCRKEGDCVRYRSAEGWNGAIGAAIRLSSAFFEGNRTSRCGCACAVAYGSAERSIQPILIGTALNLLGKKRIGDSSPSTSSGPE